ncbi:hypothetical protein IWX75_000416 [Arthrobacter sp. CAN_A6]|uniref:hypothetical protein n=1 Tax=Arthrobacter sp. CAN_A6 TaxID=2787721 RepID=UPI001A24A305
MQGTSGMKVMAGWLLSLMLVVAGFIGTVSVLNSTLYSPGYQVEEYFNALRSGNGERALGLLNASVPEGSAAVLDGAPLQRGASAVQDVEIQEPTAAGQDRVDVPVTYRIGDSDYTTSFPLEKTGSEWLFFPTWEFAPSALPTVDVSVRDMAESTVNGQRIATPEGRNTLPTFYPVELAAHYTSEYFAAPSRTLPVTSSTPADNALPLEPAPTAALVEAVDGKIREFLDSCAARAVFQPADCPFNYQTSQRLAGEIQWSIQRYPEVRIEPVDEGWALAPLAGSAQLDTQLQDLFTGAIEDVSVTRDFEFDARLTVTNSSVTVAPVIEF